MDHMDPHNGVPGEEPEDERPEGTEADDSTVVLPHAQRQPLLPPAQEPSGAAAARIVRLVAGDYLLTLNPVDGSEITGCPPQERPVPVRRTPRERAARQATVRPPVPPGPRGPELPLLEREEERERLARLLARGRSVRVAGPSGAGRSVLLDAVAAACSELAPDGVIRLSGYRRTPSDLLQELFAAVYEAEGHRPDRALLLDLLRDVGAVVVVDDLEFGGAALEDLLGSAPECAFLMSATPDVAPPAADSAVEEIFLPGLTRIACLELLEHAVERPLQDEEAAWAADLWFESEGLPLRFVQAGALLRRRDEQGVLSVAGDEPVWSSGSGQDRDRDHDLELDLGTTVPLDALRDGVPSAPAGHIPLPSLAESAAPAELLASWLGESARESLRFAVALGGEIPHQAHLPALVGDTHGDAALGELVAVGLATPVAAHYRLAAGVRQQLALADVPGGPGRPGGSGTDRAHTAAQHYAWWAGHRSVSPDRVAAEAEAILAALAACRDGGHASAAVLLARTAAPVFAAALHWSAWERTLRLGQEAARQAGEVAEEAYFHHELGVLALCTGSLDRARSELEASIALRGALADRQGTTVGRRTLALVVDRSGGPAPATTPAGVEAPTVGTDSSALPGEAPATVISKRLALGAAPGSRTGGPPQHARRRHLAAAGAGALLAAVLGTIVTLGTTSNGDDTNTPMNIKPVESAQQDEADNDLPAVSDPPDATASPGTAGSGASAGATSPGATEGVLYPGATGTSGSPSATGTQKATSRPTKTRSSSTPRPSSTHSASPAPTGSSSPSPSASVSPSVSSTSQSPSTSDSASGAVSTSPVGSTVGDTGDAGAAEGPIA